MIAAGLLVGWCGTLWRWWQDWIKPTPGHPDDGEEPLPIKPTPNPWMMSIISLIGGVVGGYVSGQVGLDITTTAGAFIGANLLIAAHDLTTKI